MKLRNYQLDLAEKIELEWGLGAKNVLLSLPTGAGKTVLFTKIMADHVGPCVAIAHRQELVGQMSVTLGRHGVRHRIIAPKSVIRFVIGLHLDEFNGGSYYDPKSLKAVAGVDTFIRRQEELAYWLPKVTLWVQDEAHHVVRTNKWGKAVAMIPNARGLGVTATPTRADGRGLGRDADGVFDVLINGPSMREIIESGYLSDYRIFAPKTADLNLSSVPVTSSGDYSKPKLSRAVRSSKIVGDVVHWYGHIARGKLGITFVTDIETGTEIAAKYRSDGVPAEVITHKTNDRTRAAILKRFKRREILQLVNVDLFGEGFDLPAVEVVSFARPTASYGLYAQQFGRGLRILEGKDRAIIIDHVDNVIRHGLPDGQQYWSLNRREKKQQAKGSEALRVCPECTGVYHRIAKACPYCGFEPVPVRRSAPEFVDGDLYELDAEALAQLRGDIAKVDMSAGAYKTYLTRRGCPQIGINSNIRAHLRTQLAQAKLRDVIARWAGAERAKGRPDWESYRRFYLDYGIDVLSAQTLGEKQAIELSERIRIGGENDISS